MALQVQAVGQRWPLGVLISNRRVAPRRAAGVTRVLGGTAIHQPTSEASMVTLMDTVALLRAQTRGVADSQTRSKLSIYVLAMSPASTRRMCRTGAFEAVMPYACGLTRTSSSAR